MDETKQTTQKSGKEERLLQNVSLRLGRRKAIILLLLSFSICDITSSVVVATANGDREIA
jgi:hypothetical protein